MDNVCRAAGETLRYWPDILLLVVFVVLACFLSIPRLPREGIVTSDKRGKELRTDLADGLCDFVEDRFHKGKITEEEREFYYKWAGNSLGLKDLLPRGQASLKEELIKRRLDTLMKPKR